MKLLVFVSLLAVGSYAADSARPTVHVRNFAVVNQNVLRGGEPTAEGLAELNAAGVKAILDLRETSSATEFEKQQAGKLGINYTNLPLPELSAPTPAEIRTALNFIYHNDAEKIYIHCRRGKDRTGTVIACYRIQHDGWGNQRALEEARQFGMSSFEHGMKAFILHFTPVSTATDPVLLTH